jgi:PEP-CTERM motif
MGTQTSYSTDTSMPITSGLTTTYSITEHIALTLSSQSRINFSSSTTLSSAVPEPSGLVLSGISVLGLAGCTARRRRARGA